MNRPGHQAYAYQQVLMWEKFAQDAEKTFDGCGFVP